MATRTSDVVIIGGGIAGLATAYYLGRAGVRSTVIERDAIGSHASGFAFGELTPSRGAGIPGGLYPLAQLGLRMNRELSPALREETGIDPGFYTRPSLFLAFTEEDVAAEKAYLPWEQEHAGYPVRWLEAADVRAWEPRIAQEVLGGVCLDGTGEVDPYKLVLALAGAAEKLGASIRHGRVTGLRHEGRRVQAVQLEHGEIPCDQVVIATGPWASEASQWVGVPFPVIPLKGEIVRLKLAGPRIEPRVIYGHHYAGTKPDGLIWAGTTVEEAGFNDAPTEVARKSITDGILRIMPALIDAQLVEQTACLRPVTADWLPILGEVPGREGVYVATGGGRKGILVGPPMGKAVADLITAGRTDVPLGGLGAGRFAGVGA